MISTPPQTVISIHLVDAKRRRHTGRGEHHRVVPGHQDHEQDAAQRGQRRMPAAVVVGRPEGGQRVEAEDHPLPIDDEVEQQADGEQRQQNPKLFVDLFDPSERSSHRYGLLIRYWARQRKNHAARFHGVRATNAGIFPGKSEIADRRLYRCQRTVLRTSTLSCRRCTVFLGFALEIRRHAGHPRGRGDSAP